MLESHPEWQQQYDIMLSLWGEHRIAEEEELDEVSARTAVSQILYLSENADTLHEHPDAPLGAGRKKRSLKTWLVAASVTGLIFVSMLLFRKSSGNEHTTPASGTNVSATAQLSETISSQRGSRTRTLLPDGSTVWLNAGSKLHYVNNFEGKTREVRLEGEGYFDIVKNPAKPFIVHTSNINIRVLGTAFNVKSYPGDKTVETTLFRGIVEVSRQDDANARPVLLKPLQKISIPVDEAIISTGKTQNEQYSVKTKRPLQYKVDKIDSLSSQDKYVETAWVYNRLEFRGDYFEELAQKLERWYNITIIFQDEKVKSLRFNGSLESETADQAFRALKTAIPFDYKIDGHDIYISSPK